MSWRIVAATDVGTSHIASGTASQDAVWADALERPDRGGLLAIFVADGAGSTTHGGIGAIEAVTAAANFVASLPLAQELTFDTALAHQLLEAVQSRIRDLACDQANPMNAYATTFQAVLIASEGTFVAQVGDGAVVLDFGHGLELIPAPPGGEFVGQTQFVTDNCASERMAIFVDPRPALRAASLTDGLTRLALDLASQQPHEPFFRPLFETLSATSEERRVMEAALQRFLASDAVASRTDDDKTLAMGVRVE